MSKTLEIEALHLRKMARYYGERAEHHRRMANRWRAVTTVLALLGLVVLFLL